MNENLSEDLKDRIDAYLAGRLDEAGVAALEDLLRGDAGARACFVRYARLHTDLYLEMRAQQAGKRALGEILQADPAADRPAAAEPGEPQGKRTALALPGIRRWLAAWGLAAACLVAVPALAWWLTAERAGEEAPVAWLVNAQNCKWADDVEPAGDMHAGKALKIERGLAEIRFRCGARVVLEGPASLELLSARGARLVRGKLTARVPGAATGFEIVSPQGKVIDLGTEFGVAVSGQGTTDVYVFQGKVEACPTDREDAQVVSLTQNQAARIADGKVVRREGERAAGADQFVRAIVPPPVIRPRTVRVDFRQAALGGVRDRAGNGTALTHRLPGTGWCLGERDPNLRLDAGKGCLELTTTDSDLNTQYKLRQGEYLGVRLADLGFTGKEDFAVAVTVLDIPALEVVGQFGLYAGARSDRNIRGGLINAKRAERGQYQQFLVNNHVHQEGEKGCDTDIGRVGLLSTGTDLRLTLRRADGKYALTVDNLTDGTSSTLTIRHPWFLDDEADLYVGLFGANTQSNVRRPLLFKDFEATVWTVAAAGPG
jgi:hypothetical protein